MEKVDIAVIGAGVVGLAIAHEFSKLKNRTIAVVEQNRTYGQETSSRNSQVIHSGIYYPAHFLKTRLCIEGRPQLYQFCAQYQVAHKKLGKLIIATCQEETPGLATLLHQAESNKVEAYLVTQRQLSDLEPHVQSCQALLVPDSGIVDVHRLMAALYHLNRQSGIIFAFGSTLTNLDFNGREYLLTTSRDQFKAEIVINSAGLHSDSIPRLLGLGPDAVGERLHPCKGEYYSLRKYYPINHLVYPLPSKSGILGIHLTPDISGRIRLGPNAYETDVISYNMDNSYQDAFYESAQRILPGLKRSDIAPDFCGIRPRRNPINETPADFLIQEETCHGFPGLVNLIGIESPGLTACLAIAQYVHGLVPR